MESLRYKRMTNAEITRLIKARIDNEELFKKKFYRRDENWAIILKTAKLNGFTPEQARIKWNNLFKQYKELLNPPTGVQTEDGELTASNWEFFDLIHSYGSTRHTIHPPLILHNSNKAYCVNKQNSFTGLDEVNQRTKDNLENQPTNQPSTSTQLARNYNKERKQAKKSTYDDILAKYKRECKRQKHETKAYFEFLEGFSTHFGFPFKPPVSESSTDTD